MRKIVFILTQDPRERTDLVSNALAQALTALDSSYVCELFLSDDAVKLILPEYIAGLKKGDSVPIAELLDSYKNKGGKIYACNPSLNSRNIDADKSKDSITGCVNASNLLESSLDAYAVFSY